MVAPDYSRSGNRGVRFLRRAVQLVVQGNAGWRCADALYGIAYCANILINGVGTFPNTNDWYGFTMWGVQFMPVVLLVMLLATWLFAVLIRLGNTKANHLG